MPRYFFHLRRANLTICDRTGYELPDLRAEPNSGETRNLWYQTIAVKRLPGYMLIITDDLGEVIFVSAI